MTAYAHIPEIRASILVGGSQLQQDSDIAVCGWFDQPAMKRAVPVAVAVDLRSWLAPAERPTAVIAEIEKLFHRLIIRNGRRAERGQAPPYLGPM